MKNGLDALVFFYGVFWALAMSGAARYQAFDTMAMWAGPERRRAWLRIAAGIVFLNGFPVAWLIFLQRFVVPEGNGSRPLVSAAVSALSVFGFTRIFHACVATRRVHALFYTELQIAQVLGPKGGAFPHSSGFAAHFYPGVLYVMVFTAVGWLVGHPQAVAVLQH